MNSDREMTQFLSLAAQNLANILQDDPDVGADQTESLVSKLIAILRDLDGFLARCDAQDWPAD